MSKPTRKTIAEAVLALSGNVSEKKLSAALAGYLVHERRSGELDAIMREVAQLRKQRHGVVEVTITSAHPLQDKVKKQLVALLHEKQVVVNEEVQEEVLGGVRMETSESQLDLTVRNRLNQFKQGVNA